MKRPRFASAPIKISSLDWSILSGGDEAIIIGRLPYGQLARRAARLTTSPAASRAAMASLSLMISGRSDGFATLLYQSLQFPDPGSWTIHIPEISIAPCAAADTHQQDSKTTLAATILSVESEGIKRISRGRQYILAAIDHVGFRSIRYLTDIAVPKDLSVRRVERNQIPGNVAGKKQSSGRRQQPRGSRIIS